MTSPTRAVIASVLGINCSKAVENLIEAVFDAGELGERVADRRGDGGGGVHADQDVR
jgi:hypothetical protein